MFHNLLPRGCLVLLLGCGLGCSFQDKSPEPSGGHVSHGAPAKGDAASGDAAHGSSSHGGDDATVTHRFEDAAHWAARFEDPARDAWQEPDRVIDAMELMA